MEAKSFVAVRWETVKRMQLGFVENLGYLLVLRVAESRDLATRRDEAAQHGGALHYVRVIFDVDGGGGAVDQADEVAVAAY